MSMLRLNRLSLLVCSLLVVSWPLKGFAQQNSDAAKAGAPRTAAARDGPREFDFELGVWKIHLKRLVRPLTGSSAWVEFDGTSATRKVWDGKAQLEEFETDSPAGGHIEGLTLRLYNPQTRQWSLYWATSKTGSMGGPPNIGEFKNGRGEFFSQDTLEHRAIFVRYVWSDITPNSAHFEQSFSDDGGKTWEVNWITDQTRAQGESDKDRGPQNLKAAKKGSPMKDRTN